MVKSAKTGKPKRALAAYMFFQMERTPKLREMHPDLPQTEIFKLVGAEWKNADANARKPYQKLADQDKIRHAREMEQWEKDGGPSDPDVLQAKRRKNKKKDPNAPKRPKSGYLFFTSQKMAYIREQNPELVQKDIMRRAGEMWKELSESEKAKYQAMSRADKERYESELKSYQAKGTF